MKKPARGKHSSLFSRSNSDKYTFYSLEAYKKGTNTLAYLAEAAEAVAVPTKYFTTLTHIFLKA
jgi:hypothetical protein